MIQFYQRTEYGKSKISKEVILSYDEAEQFCTEVDGIEYSWGDEYNKTEETLFLGVIIQS